MGGAGLGAPTLGQQPLLGPAIGLPWPYGRGRNLLGSGNCRRQGLVGFQALGGQAAKTNQADQSAAA